MLIIPETSSETPETAKSRFSEALKKEDTSFLLFRSDASNESQIQNIAIKADKYAENYGNGGYGVILIKGQDSTKDIIAQYFGSDGNIIAVLLGSGGDPRQVAKRYALNEINDNVKIGKAFTDAD